MKRLPPTGGAPFLGIALGAATVVVASAAFAEPPAEIDFDAARKHWAYQPIRKPPLPALKQRDWPASPVDAFVLARLEKEGLRPSPEADRAVLLRHIESLLK